MSCKSPPLLKYTNSFITYRNFRITTTVKISRWIRRDHYFTSINLSDAYFVIPLREEEARSTRFRGIIYEYITVMFGLGPSARIFTKLMAAVIIFLQLRFGILMSPTSTTS